MGDVLNRTNQPRAAAPEDSASLRRALIWGGLVIAWFLALCFVPDPRPLGAPEWAVKSLQKLIGVSEPAARTFATIALRSMGAALLGVLLVQVFVRMRKTIAVAASLSIAPLLAIGAMSINYGHFPIPLQMWLGIAGAVLGVLAGLVAHRNRAAIAALIVCAAGIFLWGTATGISDDLDRAARTTGLYILENADDIPNGDEGFEKIMEVAFAFAADNAHRRDLAQSHRAAILALGTILGEEKVTEVAKRNIDLSRLPEVETLRRRITLYGRNDLSRHFWVSAALAVLSDDTRSMTIGITKELMDANGGSGFSFVDLTADRAGTLFTLAATRNELSARTLQDRIRHGAVMADFMPYALDLPEGISSTDFQSIYGGLGGKETKKHVADIQQRLQQCKGLSL